MELLLSGTSPKAVCDILKIEAIPRQLATYLFCCPGLDGKLRCLPRSGGYLDQDFIEMVYFQIIEGRIKNWQSRQNKKGKTK